MKFTRASKNAPRERGRSPHPRAKFIAVATILVALVAIHAVMLHTLATEQTVAKLFGAGGDATDLVVALTFLAIRLTLHLIGPGLALYATLTFVTTRFGRSRGVSVRGMTSTSNGDAHDRRSARGAA